MNEAFEISMPDEERVKMNSVLRDIKNRCGGSSLHPCVNCDFVHWQRDLWIEATESERDEFTRELIKHIYAEKVKQ
jgi:hypothetical protein